MKRLLAAGAKAIYQVSKVFRRDEIGPLHNPEFTMVEWYRVGDGMNEGMQFTSDLCETLLDRGPAERISYREAFLKHVGIDPLAAETKTIIETVRRLENRLSREPSRRRSRRLARSAVGRKDSAASRAKIGRRFFTIFRPAKRR